MDTGMSFFSGGQDLLVNNEQREEEEEAEDQQRRNRELGHMLKNAFDDLEEEDEDDHSIVSIGQQNGSAGHSHSNTGSTCSNHQLSPQQSPYNIDAESHLPMSAVQPTYERHGGNIGVNQIRSRFRPAHDSFDEMSHNGHVDGVVNGKHMPSHNQEAEHFGYLSAIPHADFSTNGRLYVSDERPLNGSHPNEDIYRQADLNGQDQVMALLATRMEELDQLKRELATLRLERDTEVERLKRDLLLKEAEKQGAYLSHNEAQNLLSECKVQISQLRQEVQDLQLKNLTLEQSKQEVTRELKVAEASVTDLTQKVSMLERNGKGLHSEKHVESFLKNVQQQHNNEVRELQSQIENLTLKFSQKDHECCVLEHKLRDVQRSQESIITEKGKVINELHEQLQEAQRRVRECTNSVDNQEMVRLKIELDHMKAERQTLEAKLSETANKAESLEKDLRQYEAVSKMGLLHNGDSSFETDSITHLGISRRHSLGGRAEKSISNSGDSTKRSTRSQQEQNDLNVQLHDELRRALQGQKSKREEIRRLQAELALRDQKISAMKKQEKIYCLESQNFEKKLASVLERLKHQEEDAKTIQRNNGEVSALQSQLYVCKKDKERTEKDLRDIKIQLENMKTENDELQEQLADMKLQLDQAKVEQVDHTAAEFLAFHDEKVARLRQESSRQLEAQVIDYRVRMEQAHKECEEVKQLYIEVSSVKRALHTELQEEQTKVKTLTADIEDLKESLKSLEELHKQQRDLNRRLRDELDKEKSKSAKAISENEDKLEDEVNRRASAFCKDHETKIMELQEALIAKEDAVARAETLYRQVQLLEQDCQRLKKLEVECADLKKQAIEIPQRQNAEVERIGRELTQSKERVIQLEGRLRAEFQSKMDAMIAERDSIQAQLKQKDAQLEEYLQALSRIRPPTREAAVNTESGSIEALRKQFDVKIAEISSQHRTALELAEEHVKEETVKYFAEEISRMEDKYRSELANLARNKLEMEAAFAKHLTTLKSALQLKSKEVEDLNVKLQSVQQNKISTNGVAEFGGNEQLLRYVEQLKEQTESDRNKMTEALSRWATEVKELQERKSFLEAKHEELNLKYKNAKKAAIHYRKISEEKDKQTTAELSRIQSGYRQALKKVQERVDGIVNGKELEAAEQLKRIESYYDQQIKDLVKKLKQDGVTS